MIKKTISNISKFIPGMEPRRAIQKLKSDGYFVMKGVLSESECDELINSFDRYVSGHSAEAEKFTLSTKRHSRLCNMHMVSEPAKRAICKSRVMAVLDAFLGGHAFVAGSLFFEQSSEQAIHRDTPYFHTKPHNIFAGVWFALEDIHPDSGPLKYYPGGHKLEISPIQISKPEEMSSAYSKYCADIYSGIEQRRLEPNIALIKKGDCFIWHPELPHGGSPIKSPGMTRKSMVFHCAPEHSTMYSIEEFFGLVPFQKRSNPLINLTSNRKMIDHGAPMFAVNG